MNRETKIHQYLPAGNKIRITAMVLMVLLLSATSFADDVNFTATAKTSVSVGEKFQLSYKINAEGKGFRGPNITDFQVLSGPNTSTSSSVQIINGQVSRKVDYIFSYILRASKDGTYQIPPATISVDGKSYHSNALNITVASSGSSGSTGSSQGEQDTSDELYLRASISNSTPYLGEQTIITYKLYTSIQVSNLDASKISSFPGFWAKNLQENLTNIPQTREVIKGKEYVVAEVKKFALFPQRSGEIIIEAGMLDCVAQIKTSSGRKSSDPFFDSFFNDPFFNNRYQNVEKTLVSNSLKIDVKSLPTQNKPNNFSGAVGSFDFKSDISGTEVKTNEAITLKFTLSGRGNIELMNPPQINFPPDFEVYDPDISNNIRVSSAGVSGTRTFEYLIIPRNPGDFEIKPVTISYFDVAKNQYIKLSSPPYNIKVAKGENQPQSISIAGLGKEEIKYLGNDIRHIKLPPYSLRTIGIFFFKSNFYYLLLFGPLVIALLILVVWRRTVKRRSDTASMKTRKATKMARRRLKLANNYLKNKKETEFYIEISQALWGYLSDKLNIPKAKLSMENVKEILEKRKVDPALIAQFIDTLNNTEYARFAPGDKSENMDKIFREALDIISKIEGELK